MESDVPPVSPGWYPDPFGRLQFRWWDGSAWTGYAGDTAVEWDAAPLLPGAPEVTGLPGLVTALVGVAAGLGLGFGAEWALDALGRPGGLALALGVTQLALWAGLIAACVTVSHRQGTGSLVRDFSWRVRPRDLGIGLAGSIVARVMAGMAIAPIPVPFSKPRAPDRTVFEGVAGDTAGWIVLIVIVCVGAPLVEELFFRGLLQPRLVERLGVAPGLGVTALVFGAAHLVAWEGALTFLYAWSVAAAGLVLGVIRHYTGTLGAATAAHACFNIQAVVAIALLH